MTLAIERRTSPRHTTVNHQTSVQLMDWTGRRITRASLVDISTDGALILTDQTPGLNRPVRVRFDNAMELGWMVAIPVRLGRSKEVGIRFTHPCPLDFLWAARRGTDSRSVAGDEEETQLGGVRPESSASPQDER